MSSRSLWAVVIAVAASVAGLLYWGAAGDGADRGYVTLPIERGDIAAAVVATGTLNPVTMVQVGTYVSGPIQAIYADFNSPVKKGQLVAKIDPAPFQVKVLGAEANLANAEAQVRKDRADLALKKLTLERNRELFAKRLVSQNDVDTAVSANEQAEAQLVLDEARVKQAAAALEEARVNLAFTNITSPVGGVVVSRNVDVGQTVAASFQTPTLFQIAEDLTKMQVNTNVSESDIGEIAPGQPATFRVDAYPERVFHGNVTQVRNAPIILQNVVTYDVVVAVANSDLALKPGMTATVSVTTQERRDVVRLPLRALRFKPEANAGDSDGPAAAAAAAESKSLQSVWVLRADGDLSRVDVKLGVRNDEHAELLSDGIAPGDHVVIGYESGRRPEAEAGSPFLQPPRRR
jgi:HlyD family secretion protein